MRIKKLEYELKKEMMKNKSGECEEKLQKAEVAIRAISQEVMLIKQGQK